VGEQTLNFEVVWQEDVLPVRQKRQQQSSANDTTYNDQHPAHASSR